MSEDFMGAKLALFVGDDLAVILRDDIPGLLWAGFWDLPGGGAEPGETPIECALRETHEELSLVVAPDQISWGRAYTNSIGRQVWFFACHLPSQTQELIQLGDEGQRWDLMSPGAFLAHERVVPQFKPRLQDYLDGKSGHPLTERPPA